MHLLREGQFAVATTFLTEAKAKPSPSEPFPELLVLPSPLEDEAGIDTSKSELLREKFTSMYHILHELKNNRNLLPAIAWAKANSATLEIRGSNLEFELGRLQFIWLFSGGSLGHDAHNMFKGQQLALDYARKEFGHFQARYLGEIQQLGGAMAFCPNLAQSPYGRLFHDDGAWNDLAQSFTREFCFLLGLSAESPLYIAATAGAIALPTLVKLQAIMKEKRTEWTTQNELPVRFFFFFILSLTHMYSPIQQ